MTVRIKKVVDATITEENDILAVEEPIEIRVTYFDEGKRTTKNISVTMRTTGNDEELAAGFLFTEGIVSEKNQIESVKISGLNSVTVTLSPESHLNLKSLERNFYTTSSCGVCGKSSIDAIATTRKFDTKDNFKITSKLLQSLPVLLRQKQNIFNQTGGLHASALVNSAGEIITVREDVGRHNALDKLIGYHLMNDTIPLTDYLLLLSGRASFELMQKAYMAGIPFVAAVGAPSSLAVEFATDRNMTLVGFLRDSRFNIYHCEERIGL